MSSHSRTGKPANFFERLFSSAGNSPGTSKGRHKQHHSKPTATDEDIHNNVLTRSSSHSSNTRRGRGRSSELDGAEENNSTKTQSLKSLDKSKIEHTEAGKEEEEDNNTGMASNSRRASVDKGTHGLQLPPSNSDDQGTGKKKSIFFVKKSKNEPNPTASTKDVSDAATEAYITSSLSVKSTGSGGAISSPQKGSAITRDSSREEKSGPTEYQKENNLEHLFEKYAKEMDIMRQRFKGREDEDTVLYRFLKAFDHNVEAASKRLEQSLIWRKENNYSELVEKYKNVPYDKLPNFRMISRFYPHNESYGFDNDGNMISITQQGKIDPIAFPLNITIQQMAEYQVPLIAKKMYELTELSKQKGYLVRGTMIVDLDGLGIKHLAPHLLEYLRSLAQMLQVNFPEVLHKSIVINAPKAFHMGWKAIKQFLEPGVQQKFAILGKDYMDELYQHFERHQLPPFLGGTNPEVCIVDYEEGFETKEFYGSFDIPTLVHVVGDNDKKVLWDFRCEKEVKYTIEFFSEHNNDSMEVCPKKKAEAHRLTIGEWVLPGPGQNSVRYKISVAPVNQSHEEEHEAPEIKLPEEKTNADLKKSMSGANLTMNIQLSEDVFKAKMRGMEKKMDKLDDRFDEFEQKLKVSKAASDRTILLLLLVIVLQLLLLAHVHQNSIKDFFTKSE